MVDRKRNKTIDAMKALSTIMVVYIHSHNIVNYAGIESRNAIIQMVSVLTGAGVPTFFLVSAYLMKKSAKPYKENIKKKVKTLLLPYLLWILIYVMLEVVGNKVLPASFSDVTKWSGVDWIKNLVGIPFIESPIYIPLWFVRDLFVLNLMAPVFDLVINRAPYCITLIIIGGGGWYLPLPGYFRQAICFFMLGLFMGAIEAKNEKFFISKKMSTFLTIIFMLGIVVLPDNYYLTRTKILMAIALLYFICRFICENREYKWLQSITSYSFWIYATHGKLLSILQTMSIRVLTQSDGIILAEFLIFPVVVILICITLGTAVQKLCPQVYSVLTGGR